VGVEYSLNIESGVHAIALASDSVGADRLTIDSQKLSPEEAT
jgi:hypothetical protein